ncbi:ABC transporter permease [Ferrovibrio xuzhouensis]|uniref:ABC transporter permease n=1 Tax=Ferrovibrio xuzhouensis TaxID=1576914 RepID=A0ABV7VMG3_9PROT
MATELGVDGMRSAAPKARRFFLDPMVLVWIAVAVVLVALVANPLARLLIDSFQVPRTGGWTFANFVAAFGRARHIQAFTNTLQLATAVAVISGAMGVPLAWAVSRTDMPWRGFMHVNVLAAFIIPPFLGAIGWILLAGPNAGWLNRAWMLVTGMDAGPFNVFSFWGLAFVIAIYVYPLVYIFTSSALDLISSEMEEAAAIHGAGTLRTTLQVTLPLALPAILGALIIVFLEAMALYGTPALIAIPARFNVVTTQLSVFFQYPLRIEVAAAFSMPLVGITVVLLVLQRLMLARRGYVSVSGKGGERRRVRLGFWRWPIFAYASFISLVSVILPLFVLVQTSFARAWGQGLSLDNLTLANFHYILFEQMTVRQSIWNTFSYSGVTATACCALGFSIAYIVHRRLLPGGAILTGLTMAPFAVPGIVLAICFYAAYAGPPFQLYGTGTLIVVAFITRFMPIAFATAASGVRGLHPELEEAVRILGGGRFTVVTKVVLPLLKKTLLGAWILVFIICTRELSTAIFLSGPESRVISVLTLDLSEQGHYEILAAMGVVLLIVTTAVVGVGMKLLGRDFMLRRN